MEDIDKKFIDMYGTIGSLYGISDVLVKSMAILYLEPEEVAMDELVKKTGYSLASISNCIKMLEGMCSIRRSRKPGTKKIFLYMEKDFRKIWKDALVKKQEVVFGTVKAKLPAIIDEYRAKAKTEKHKRKLKILENYYNQILLFDRIVQNMVREIDELKW